jgi:dTMP kinase
MTGLFVTLEGIDRSGKTSQASRLVEALGVEEVARLNDWATDGLMPYLTILLWLDPDLARARAGEHDRFEDEGADLQRAVAEAYDRLAAADQRRWRRVDASRPVDEVHADVVKLVEAARAGAGAAA